MRKNKKGFSLIELVIVIAILAVLAAVLAPALIHYVEDSRATSDIHSMDEVVNAVQIGLANPEAYDEMVDASVDGNVACYIDSSSESGRDKEIVKVGANGTAYYTFDDDNRLLDEVPYTAAGNMRGVTITFIPNTASKNLTYDLKNAVINKHVGGTALLSDYPNLYNRVRQTIGDTITLDSNTYENSEYTIFIRVGSGGGNQATAQDPIQVYGQYNGTNLPKSYTSGGTAADRDDTYTPPTNTNPPSGGGAGTGGTPVTPPPVSGGDTGGSGTTNNDDTPIAGPSAIPRNTKYIIHGMQGTSIEVDNENNIIMKDRHGNTLSTIPSICVQNSSQSLIITNTGTEYDGTYGTLENAKYLYMQFGDEKHTVAMKEGTCDHGPRREDEENVYYFNHWYGFYDHDDNYLNLTAAESTQMLKNYVLRCETCYNEIPCKIFDDSDYVYVYNAYLEPQRCNGQRINGTCVDMDYAAINGWWACPIDIAKTDNLYATIDGKPVTYTSVYHGSVIPKSITYIDFSTYYNEQFQALNVDTLEATFLGTSNEFEAKMASPYTTSTAVQTITERIRWASIYLNKDVHVIIHCSDKDITISSN